MRKELLAVIDSISQEIEKAVQYIQWAGEYHPKSVYKQCRVSLYVSVPSGVVFVADSIKKKNHGLSAPWPKSTCIQRLPKRQLLDGGLSSKYYEKVVAKTCAVLEKMGKYPKRDVISIDTKEMF